MPPPFFQQRNHIQNSKTFFFPSWSHFPYKQSLCLLWGCWMSRKGQGSHSRTSCVEGPHDVSTTMWPTSWNINNCKPLIPHPSDLQTVYSLKSWLPPRGAVRASKTRGNPAIWESIISASVSHKKGISPMPVRAPLYQLLICLGFLYVQAAMQVPLFVECCLLQSPTKLAESTSVSGITNLQTDLNSRVSWRE